MFVTRQTIRLDYALMFVTRRTVRHDYTSMFVTRQTIRLDYKFIFVQRRAPRRDYTIVFVQRRAPRRDYSLMFVQRRAPRRDYSLVFVQRRAPRRDYSLVFVQRKAPRRDYSLVFVQRRAPRRDYSLMFVQRKAPRHDYHLVFCSGEHLAGNLMTRSHRRNGRGGACVPARTSAQRRFHQQRVRPHPQKRRFHLPSLHSHLQMWHFQLLSPPYIIGRRGVYIPLHLIIYINHARAHCPSCCIMRQCCVFHGVILFSRAIACVSWRDRPRLPRQWGGNRGDDRAARPQGCPCRPTSPRVIATRTLAVARLAAVVWRCRDLDRRAARPSYPHRIRLPASRRACRNGRAQKLAGHHR